MPVWKVRAKRWYPRKETEQNAVQPPKRKQARVPNSWEDSGFGNITVPVEADSAEEAEQKALNSEYVEELRDMPTYQMKTIK